MNWRAAAYRVCFTTTMIFIMAVVILSWLYPEHLR